MADNETEYGRYAETLQGAVELAAAAATAEVSRIFHRLSRASSRKQSQVADLLKVSEGRVSQVLNGDGNVTVAALAKYVRAYGYTLSFVITPAEPGVPPAAEARPRRRRGAQPPHRALLDKYVASYGILVPPINPPLIPDVEGLVGRMAAANSDFRVVHQVLASWGEWSSGSETTTSTGTGKLQ